MKGQTVKHIAILQYDGIKNISFFYAILFLQEARYPVILPDCYS